MFQKFPHGLELIVRFLMKGFSGQFLHVILNKISSGIPATFTMYPFSTDPLYEQMDIVAGDGSGMKHTSKNGNLWLSCNSPIIDERYVDVTLPSK